MEAVEYAHTRGIKIRCSVTASEAILGPDSCLVWLQCLSDMATVQVSSCTSFSHYSRLRRLLRGSTCLPIGYIILCYCHWHFQTSGHVNASYLKLLATATVYIGTSKMHSGARWVPSAGFMCSCYSFDNTVMNSVATALGPHRSLG